MPKIDPKLSPGTFVRPMDHPKLAAQPQAAVASPARRTTQQPTTADIYHVPLTAEQAAAAQAAFEYWLKTRKAFDDAKLLEMGHGGADAVEAICAVASSFLAFCGLLVQPLTAQASAISLVQIAEAVHEVSEGAGSVAEAFEVATTYVEYEDEQARARLLLIARDMESGRYVPPRYIRTA